MARQPTRLLAEYDPRRPGELEMYPFGDAADLLTGRPVRQTSEASARALLDRIFPGGFPLDTSEVACTAGLLRIAGRLAELFETRAPLAPGLTFVGGVVNPSTFGLVSPGRGSVSGGGEQFGPALLACLGEAAEWLSALTTPAVERTGRDKVLADLRALFQRLLHDDPSDVWLAARLLNTDEPSWAPAMLVDSRAAGGQADGTAGCAAGPSPRDATRRAVLELVERDAVALWWFGGSRARAIGDAFMSASGATALLARLRGAAPSRSTWLLDITSDLGIPTIGAISCDADGFGVAFGFAARTNPSEAARRAVIELCQMEFGSTLIRHKVERFGRDGLNEVEQRHLRRMEELPARACDLLAGAGPSKLRAGADRSRSDELGAVIQKLNDKQVHCWAIDLTTGIGVPVVRTVAPALQTVGGGRITSRLLATIDRTGGPSTHAKDIQPL